ncbi:hypothetical protein KC316_g64 [Hortaea werneckii]|nr:hypothetical protein KC316_g64 [Hortaea werneckii]
MQFLSLIDVSSHVEDNYTAQERTYVLPLITTHSKEDWRKFSSRISFEHFLSSTKSLDSLFQKLSYTFCVNSPSLDAE